MAHEELLQKFKKTFLARESDIDGFIELIDPGCQWTIMATGETFCGREEIREMARRSVAGRRHTDDIKRELATLFATEDYLVVEYVHNAIVTADWPSGRNRPAPGTVLSVPICIVAHIKGEKLNWIDEYFDLATALGVQGEEFYS